MERKLFRNLDLVVLGLTLAIMCAGLPVMYSASFGKEGGSGVFTSHLVRLGLGLLAILASLLPDYHLIARSVPVLWVLNCLALLWVDLAGLIGLGARRWISLGPASLQPSELFKIILILSLARFLTRVRQGEEPGWADLGVTGLFTAVPLLLILKQPDLGTASIVLLIYLTVILVNGFSRRTWMSLLGWGLVLGAAAFLVFRLGVLRVDQFLKPYQLKRIMVLVEPGLDPLGASYHINQSKIAIGSGGMWGKGFLNGTQNQLRFLPEQHTDFIFSVLAEEWGFIGVAVVVTLFAALIMAALQAARDARDRLGALIALGVAAMIFFQAVINIGMTVGVMPVVGIPLPLMSYGGSSSIVTLMGIGLVLNVRLRRFIL
jgi:rod shape determining protein RodA